MAPDESKYPGASDGELLDRFSRWEKDLSAHWGDWRTEARECYDLVAGHQWSKEEEEALENMLRPHVTFNRIGPVIDAVSGAEIQNRQQVTYLPRQVGASAVNEVLTKGVDWLRDGCDAEYEESDSAWDTFVCGVGCTETWIDYEEEPDGKARVDRVDPLEIRVDPSARKRNYADARYLCREKPYSLDEFKEEWPGVSPDGSDDDGMKRPTVVDPAVRYRNGAGDDDMDGETVVVKEWQWFEREPYFRVAHPDTGEMVEVSEGDYQEVDGQAKAAGVELGGVRQVRRVFYRAFEASGDILKVEKIGVEDFTYTFMTGKRDRNKGLFYGLVRPMKDPQKFANKFFGQILHILNSNAKGGVALETDAVEDQRQFEESWAQADAITWMKPGAVSGEKMMPKAAIPYPQGQDRLMEVSVTAIRDSTGVNQEILGLADRDQPGVLEHQRKQAAYGILAAFFDSFKRYRKIQGRKFLRFIQLYLPKDTLVRIVGDDGLAQYVPLALQDSTMKFDVIVDDAPAGPNQKNAAFQMLLQLMPILQNSNLPPSVWAEFVRYSPLPTALSEKIVQALMQMEQAAQQPSPEQQLALAHGQAQVQDTQASAAHHEAQANRLNAETGAIQAGGHASEVDQNSAKAALDRARVTSEMMKAVAAVTAANKPSPASPA